MTRRIPKALFDLLAIGTRRAMTRFLSTELSWWSDLDGDVLGTVFLDHTDKDYGWIILVKDLVRRFRCADVGIDFTSERKATADLRIAMSEKVRAADFEKRVEQGDEPKHLLDLFQDRGIPDHKLHPYYLELRDRLGRSPARRVFEAISPWMVSSDPHLVREFQERHFDQRLWEIYLWAMFRDQGYDVDHQEAPDLLVSSPLHSFTVEATTVAPSTSGVLADHPNPETPEEVAEFLANYMPMKFGSALTSKLNKVDANGLHYWEKGSARDLPFVIAVADFHKPAEGARLGSMAYTQGALHPYLYGHRVSAEVVNGEVAFKHTPVTVHTYNGKTVPSGFFDLPGAENVSAVLFSNAGTLAKFDRIGVLAGFAPPGCRYLRQGFLYDANPEAITAIPFQAEVGAPGYQEGWGDEVQVFHNPRALHPIDPGAFPDASQFTYIDGQFAGMAEEHRVLRSFTVVLQPEVP